MSNGLPKNYPRIGRDNFATPRVAEVAREHGWHPPKSLDSDKNFKPEHWLFCRKLRFVAIYTLFGDLWAKTVPYLGQKQCFLGKKCIISWYILHIYKFAITRKNDAFVANSKYGPDDNLCGH